MASYRVASVPLTAAVTRMEIAPPGRPISKITVRKMSLGANVLLHYGDSGEGIDLASQGERFALCPPETGGIYVTVPTAQAGTIKLLLSSPEGEVDSLGVGSPGNGDARVPISPVHASIETPGSTNGPASIHLFNPVASVKLLRLRKLQVHCSTGQVIKIRRTTAPVDFAGGGAAIISDTPVHLDERDVAAVVGVFEGTNFPVGGATFTRAQAQWQFPITDQQGNGRFYYLEETDFPQSISPGSAVEIAVDAFGSGIILRAHAVWDEE